jgi:hypothetical protein
MSVHQQYFALLPASHVARGTKSGEYYNEDNPPTISEQLIPSLLSLYINSITDTSYGECIDERSCLLNSILLCVWASEVWIYIRVCKLQTVTSNRTKGVNNGECAQHSRRDGSFGGTSFTQRCRGDQGFFGRKMPQKSDVENG